MPVFRDHFTVAARSYAAFRPHYPDALFDWLHAELTRRERAWDCGTGSGQAAVALAGHFREVIASDPSIAQLANAERHRGVRYLGMTAEHAALAAHSVDLVTVAQALHWFDRPSFFAEVDRVLRPGGALAVWSYGLLAVGAELDAVLGHLYMDVLGPYWPSERALVDRGYAGIALPFAESPGPDLAMEATWTLEQLGGYLSTWSAVGRYRSSVGTDPLPDVMRQLALAWGTAETRCVRWPLVVRLARKNV